MTARDLCWHDCETCVVDVRVFGVERQAALAAAAADDAEAVVVHAARAVAEYRGDFLPGMYDDWLLEIRSSWNASAWACVILWVPKTGATWPDDR